jgi:hypothetical protein
MRSDAPRLSLCAATSTDVSATQKSSRAGSAIAAVVLILAAAAVGGFLWHRHQKAQARAPRTAQAQTLPPDARSLSLPCRERARTKTWSA